MTILPMSFPHQMAAQHLQKQGVQKSLKTDLSSGENASFMVTAYLNYQVPCLN